MDRECSLCGLNLSHNPKYRVYSYWKIACPDNWYIYVCNACKAKKIDVPCSEDELVTQIIRKGFQIKHGFGTNGEEFGGI